MKSNLQKLKTMLDEAFNDIARAMDNAPGMMFDLSNLSRAIDAHETDFEDLCERVRVLEERFEGGDGGDGGHEQP